MIVVIQKNTNQVTVQKQVALRVRIAQFNIPSGVPTNVFTEEGQLLRSIGVENVGVLSAPAKTNQTLRSDLAVIGKMRWVDAGSADVMAPSFDGWRDNPNPQVNNADFLTTLQSVTAANRARGLASAVLTTPTGAYPGSNAFVGGVLLPDGRVFCVPFNSTTARIYDPVTDTLTTPTGTYPGSGAFYGGVLLPDGRVFCVPRNSTSGAVANTRSHVWLDSNLTTSPFFNKL
jgi:hypothetical protein